MELVTEIYRSTKTFPKEEIYGLSGQIRRAAVSIPGNIAEGQGRLTPGEFRQFLGYARGSLLELETLILVARNVNYLDYDKAVFLSTQSGEVGKIFNGLLNTFYK
ncbi:MAG: four helix bundle protein [Candidatus Binatia bacterium]